MAYVVELTPRAARQYRRVPRNQQAAIRSRIDDLANDPRPPGCERLQSFPYYRVRAGNYRIIYEIRDDDYLVVIQLIGHSRDLYRHPRNL